MTIFLTITLREFLTAGINLSGQFGRLLIKVLETVEKKQE